MPSIEENLRHWGSDYHWRDRGEEWSEVWGGSDAEWRGSILPRVRAFLPARRALEIGCGHGRWSARLRPWCRQITLFDLVPACVEACRERFAGDRRVSCRVTDGRTLPGPEPGSIDLAFSFDSLVHAELDVLAGYLGELARLLSPEGVAFLHHSNFGAVLAARPGTENRHWRAESASADGFREACAAAGLVCPRQEVVDWGGVEDCDAFSLVARPGSSRDRPPERRRNPHFMGEAQSLAARSALWGLEPEGAPAGRWSGWRRGRGGRS